MYNYTCSVVYVFDGAWIYVNGINIRCKHRVNGIRVTIIFSPKGSVALISGAGVAALLSHYKIHILNEPNRATENRHTMTPNSRILLHEGCDHAMYLQFTDISEIM